MAGAVGRDWSQEKCIRAAATCAQAGHMLSARAAREVVGGRAAQGRRLCAGGGQGGSCLWRQLPAVLHAVLPLWRILGVRPTDTAHPHKPPKPYQID